MALSIIATAVAALLVLLDQLIKQWAVDNLMQEGITLISGVLSLIYHENYGAAFGIMQGMQTFLIVVTGIVLALILVWMFSGRLNSKFMTWSLALVVAGGVGNLIDRVQNGYVVDYIYFEIINFPVFNLADCCVVIGTGLILIYVMMEERILAKKAKTATDSGEHTPIEGATDATDDDTGHQK